MDVIEDMESSYAAEDFLRRVFLQDLTFANRGDIVGSAENLGQALSEHQFATQLPLCCQTAEAMDEMRYEFNRLFVGPFRPKAVPYESAYFGNGTLLGEATMDVRRFYEEAGLAVCQGEHGRTPDDYIGFELQFLYYLSSRSLEYLEKGDEDRFCQALETKREFLLKHPCAWFGNFVQSLEGQTDIEPWTQLGSFLLLYLDEEKSKLNRILDCAKS